MAKPKKNENIKWIWGAQPASWGGLGPQGFAVQMALADVLFFGGSRGGGKSDATIGRHLIKAEKYGPHHNGLIIRRKYKDFGELRRRIRELIADGLPAELVGGDNQPNTWRFTGECYKGAVVQLIAVRFPEQLSDFEGWQMTEISIEEAGHFPFISTVLDKMQGCMRSPHGVPCHIFMTGNPGGPGTPFLKKNFVKAMVDTVKPGHPIWDSKDAKTRKRWAKESPDGRLMMVPTGGKEAEIIMPFYDETGEFKRIFIPSNVEDNLKLMQNDPHYVNRLKAIRDPALRAAWLEGDWDAVLGGFFEGIFSKEKNVVAGSLSWLPPRHWRRIMSFDWGSATPFSVGWHAISDGQEVLVNGEKRYFPKGAYVRYDEWYGAAPGLSNTGLKLQSPDVANGIKERERARQEHNLPWDRVAGVDLWSQKDGPSPATRMEARGLVFSRAITAREQGWDRLASMFRGMDGGLPLYYVTEKCRDFLEIVPTLERDDLNWEVIDTDQEDHLADDARYCVMHVPGHIVQQVGTGGMWI